MLVQLWPQGLPSKASGTEHVTLKRYEQTTIYAHTAAVMHVSNMPFNDAIAPLFFRDEVCQTLWQKLMNRSVQIIKYHDASGLGDNNDL